MNPSPLNAASLQPDLLLIKENLAAYFREEIISGRLSPGEKIVEVKWAKQLGISQTSVREALNILSAEGFVQKDAGRTARVTLLSESDVLHSYELRGLLEGYAARIVADKKMDVSELEQVLVSMQSAIETGDLRSFYERDLHFHLLLAEKTGNPMLVLAIKRIILPLFAFVVIRVQGARTEQEQWHRSLEQHRRIVDGLKTHDPIFAERLVSQMVGFFLEDTRSKLIK